jgi:hypothetical protein
MAEGIRCRFVSHMRANLDSLQVELFAVIIVVVTCRSITTRERDSKMMGGIQPFRRHSPYAHRSHRSNSAMVDSRLMTLTDLCSVGALCGASRDSSSPSLFHSSMTQP